MQICPQCRKPIFADEGFTHIQFVDACPFGHAGTYSLCPRCLAVAEGRAIPERPVYPVGAQPPVGVIVCGVCRHALPTGMTTEHLHLYPEDIAGTEITLPGKYGACYDCRQRFRRAWLRDMGGLQAVPVIEAGEEDRP